MKISIGKWRTRGGDVATVTVRYADEEFPWQGTIGGIDCSWLDDGRWGAELCEYSYDLIELIDTQKPFTGKKLIDGTETCDRCKNESTNFQVQLNGAYLCDDCLTAPRIEVGQLWDVNKSKNSFKILATNAEGCEHIVVQYQNLNLNLSKYSPGWILKNCKRKMPKVRMSDESVLPPWIIGYAMDKNGKWYMYNDKPVMGETFWKPRFQGNLLIPKEYAPQNIPDDFDWRNSLVEVKR